MDGLPRSRPQYESGDIAWIMCATTMVWLMIPGLAYFYSGLARIKNALSLIIHVMICMMVASVQWFIWGYSLTFSTDGSSFLGSLQFVFLQGLRGQPSAGTGNLPDVIFVVFQGMFQSVTAALVIGGCAERARTQPMVLFIFIWTTVVYNVLAYWTWNARGWSLAMGGLDYAGGTPVHIGSGFASLAYALVVGKRIGYHKNNSEFKAHNVQNVILGTSLLWFGWFGFNGGSVLSSSPKVGMVTLVTHLAATTGGMTWITLDYFRHRRFSALAMCSGAVAGLVAITPASGYVSPGPSVLIGFLGAVACRAAVVITKKWFDDALDVFAIHGVGGYVGCILTGIFADREVAAIGSDGTDMIRGGWLNRHWQQIGYQFAQATAGAAWAFGLTFLVCFVMNKVPGLSLRVSEQDELKGLDQAELDESAYYYVTKLVTVDTRTGAETTVHEEVKAVHQDGQGEEIETFS